MSAWGRPCKGAAAPTDARNGACQQHLGEEDGKEGGPVDLLGDEGHSVGAVHLRGAGGWVGPVARREAQVHVRTGRCGK